MLGFGLDTSGHMSNELHPPVAETDSPLHFLKALVACADRAEDFRVSDPRLHRTVYRLVGEWSRVVRLACDQQDRVAEELTPREGLRP